MSLCCSNFQLQFVDVCWVFGIVSVVMVRQEALCQLLRGHFSHGEAGGEIGFFNLLAREEMVFVSIFCGNLLQKIRSVGEI